MNYTFTNQADLSAYGEHLIETEVYLKDDENPANNAKSKTVVNKDPSMICIYSVVAYDDYGDGWNGGSLTITEDGETVLDHYEMDDGSGPEVIEFEVTVGGTLEASFDCGNDCYECSYEVRDLMHHVIFEDGMDGNEPEGGEIGEVSCTPVFYDATVILIDIPVMTNPGMITPAVTVLNDGYETVTFDVGLTIDGGYSSSRTVTGLAYGETSIVEFDVWNATVGDFTAAACTQLEDDEIPENDCMNRTAKVVDNEIFYAYNVFDPSSSVDEGPIAFLADDPSVVELISKTTSSKFITGACWADGAWYASQYNGGLYTIDPGSGVMEFIGDTDGFNGLAYDNASHIMYGVTNWQLFRVDPETGESTFIGDLHNDNGGFMIAIACNNDGDLYGIDLADDNLYFIDPATGSSEIVGPLGFDINFAQDMAWDKDNDILYLSAYTESGGLYTCDPENGSCELIGEFTSGMEVTGFAIPNSGNPAYSNDVRVVSILSPETGEDLATEDVTVVVKNNGSNDQEDVPVYYTIDGGDMVSEIVPGTLEAGAMIEYTFSEQADLSVWDATYVIEACTNLPGDERPENDCKSIEVTNIAPCVVECPPDATPENEPCGESTNNGCNIWTDGSNTTGGTKDPSFGSISDGETICGTAWYDGQTRDIDEYLFTIEQAQNVTLTGNAEFPFAIYFIDMTNGCDNSYIMWSGIYEKCEEGSINIDITEPGDYVAFFAPHFVDPITCDDRNAYWIRLDIDPWVPTYCVEDLYMFGCEWGDGIVSFELRDLNFDPINCDGAPTYEYDWYHDWTGLSTPVQDQDIVTFTAGYGNTNVRAWIDFNDDYFWDEDEMVLDNFWCEEAYVTYQTQLTIPSGVAYGEHTMRIRTNYGGVGSSCDMHFYGNALDFMAEIGPPVYPEVSVDPESMELTMMKSTMTEQTLTIHNNGEGTLHYTLDIDLGDRSDGIVAAVYPKIELPVRVSEPVNPTTGSMVATDDEVILKYDSGDNDHGVGLDIGGDFVVAAYWPSASLTLYTGISLTDVEIFTKDVDGIEFALKVWGEGTQWDPGELIVDQLFTPDAESWNTITLDTPVIIDGSDIWVGYSITGSQAGQGPAGTDDGPPVDGFGNMISNGTYWTTLSNFGLDYNWNIHARLEGEIIDPWLTAEPMNGHISPGESAEINIMFNADDLDYGSYEGWIMVSSNDPENPQIDVPVYLDVTNEPWTFNVTGLVHTINVPATANPNIFGEPLEEGDWVGVFYLDDDGDEQCGGAAAMDESGGAVVSAYGDDITTPEKDGFDTDELFRWRIFDVSDLEGYQAGATYDVTMPNQGYFADFGLSKVTSLEGMFCQYYSFNAGWNSMSSYILPLDAEVENLFAPVVDELIIFRNLTGVYWPGENVNSMGEFDNTSGYVLKAAEDFDFEICGEEFAGNEMTLYEGWSYLPVLGDCDTDVMDLFGDHTDDIVIVQDLIGTGIFWPDMGIYSLENLSPGNAYKIKVINEFTITFPECDGKLATKTSAHMNSASNHWGTLNMTPATQPTAFLNAAMVDFEEGDVIGAFGADNKLFGYLQINSTKQNQAIILYGDDATTTQQNGFTEGEKVAYRLYRAFTGEEFVLDVEFDQTMDNSTGTYESESFAVINKVKMSNTGINEMGEATIEIYPNPASEEITIKLNNRYSGVVGVKIIDSKGQVLVEKNFTNTTNLNVSTFSGGVYYVKINNEDINEVRKIVIR